VSGTIRAIELHKVDGHPTAQYNEAALRQLGESAAMQRFVVMYPKLLRCSLEQMFPAVPLLPLLAGSDTRSRVLAQAP
jgi:hypothetical protein